MATAAAAVLAADASLTSPASPPCVVDTASGAGDASLATGAPLRVLAAAGSTLLLLLGLVAAAVAGADAAGTADVTAGLVLAVVVGEALDLAVPRTMSDICRRSETPLADELF